MKTQGAVSNTAQESAPLTTTCKLSRRGRRTRTKHKKIAEAKEMRKNAERSATEAAKAHNELATFKSDAVWRQRAREGKQARQETFSVRRSLHHLSACAVEVVLLIRNSIDKHLLDELKVHADRVPKQALLHDKTLNQDAVHVDARDDPHNTSVTKEPTSSLHARVRHQSRGNLRGTKGEFHLIIYSLHP